jgi:hypothetical protein
MSKYAIPSKEFIKHARKNFDGWFQRHLQLRRLGRRAAKKELFAMSGRARAVRPRSVQGMR